MPPRPPAASARRSGPRNRRQPHRTAPDRTIGGLAGLDECVHDSGREVGLSGSRRSGRREGAVARRRGGSLEDRRCHPDSAAPQVRHGRADATGSGRRAARRLVTAAAAPSGSRPVVAGSIAGPGRAMTPGPRRGRRRRRGRRPASRHARRSTSHDRRLAAPDRPVSSRRSSTRRRSPTPTTGSPSRRAPASPSAFTPRAERPLVRRRRDADGAAGRAPRRPGAPDPDDAATLIRDRSGPARTAPSTCRPQRGRVDRRSRRRRSFTAGARRAARRHRHDEAAVSPAGLRREIFGFLPYWELNLELAPPRLQPDLDDRLLRRSARTAAGNLQKRNADGSTTVGWSGWTSSRLTSIISAAHRNHTRVVLTVQSFGWNDLRADRQKRLLGSPDGPGQPRPPDRGRGPRPRRRRRQPRLRAARPRLRDASSRRSSGASARS